MKIVDCNEERTVGIVEEADGVTHVGGFSPELLDMWMQTIVAALEPKPDDTIHLFFKKTGASHGHTLLLASKNGDEPMVAIGVALAGKVPGDGEPWGKDLHPGVVQ